MRNSLEKSQGVLLSADIEVSADTAEQYRPQLSFEQVNSKVKARKEQQAIHENIEMKTKKGLDIELEEKMNQIDLESFVLNE